MHQYLKQFFSKFLLEMTKAIPGSVGWSVTGDRSIEFAKQPIDFIERRIKQHDSKIFITRALNVPTVFVCSNEGVRKIFGTLHRKFYVPRACQLLKLVKGVAGGQRLKLHFDTNIIRRLQGFPYFVGIYQNSVNSFGCREFLFANFF